MNPPNRIPLSISILAGLVGGRIFYKTYPQPWKGQEGVRRLDSGIVGVSVANIAYHAANGSPMLVVAIGWICYLHAMRRDKHAREQRDAAAFRARLSVSTHE